MLCQKRGLCPQLWITMCIYAGGYAPRNAYVGLQLIPRHALRRSASQDIISALSGKIGRLKGVSTKTAYSNVITHMEEKHD